MKRFLLIAATLFIGWGAHTQASDDFGQVNGQSKPMTAQELQTQLQVDGDVYGVDAKGGRVLFRGGENRQWRFNGQPTFQSNWSIKIDDYPQIALKHLWSVGEDGVIKVKIQQYESMTTNTDDNNKKVQVGKLIREEEKTIKDFSPIEWGATSKDGTQLVVRFIPSLRETEPPDQDISDFPLAGTHILISDNQGRTWSEPIGNLNSKYVAFTTFRGQIALSYYQFPGSRKLGVAKGNVLELEVEKNLKVRFTSGSPFLPGEMSANVYGVYDANKKTSRLRSTHIMTTNKEARLLEVLGLANRGSASTPEKISFKALHMGIKDALVSLGRQAGKNFEIAKDVTNEDIVQMDVKDVEWTEALQFLLDEGHLKYQTKKDGTVAITKKGP